MQLIINKLIILLTLLIFISCSNGQNKFNSNNFKKSNDILLFEFPDTVYEKQVVYGKVKYNLQLDSLELSEIDERFVLLYITTHKGELNLKSVEKIEHSVFIDTIGNGTINFNVNFANSGNNLLNGIIEDKIFLKTPTKEGKIRIITKETNISKEVYTIGPDGAELFPVPYQKKVYIYHTINKTKNSEKKNHHQLCL